MNDVDRHGEVLGRDAVRFRRLLPGPIDRVWEHLVDGDKRGRWLCSGKTGSAVGDPVELIFRNFELTDAPDTPPPDKHKDMPEVVEMSGTITEWDPPHVFAHTWVFGDEQSEVRYELEERGDEVLLTLTNSRLLSREMVVDVCGGWHAHLDILEEILSGKAPGPFWKRIRQYEQDYETRVAT